MKRRNFLEKSLKLGGYSLLASTIYNTHLSKALADAMVASPESQDRFYVQIYVNGGWDVSLGPNPWSIEKRPDESDYFIEYTQDQIISIGNGFMGPAMQNLKPYVAQMAIVNGVFMSRQENGHPANVAYITSGSGSGATANVAAEFESAALSAKPLGVLTNQSIFTADRIVATSTVNNCLDINPDDLITHTDVATPLQDLAGDLAAYSKNLMAAKDELAKLPAPPVLDQFDFKSAQSAALAFKYGLSRAACFSVRTNNLDTHSDHPIKHLAAQKAAWDQVAAWFKIFQDIEYKNGESLFSHTTFTVMSEFSRSPHLNQSKGKEHNPFTNSVLFAGGGIKAGGLVVGGSKLVPAKSSSIGGMPYLIALSTDMTTGLPIADRKDAAKGKIITPEIIAATIGEALKVDRKVFASGYGSPTLPILA